MECNYNQTAASKNVITTCRAGCDDGILSMCRDTCDVEGSHITEGGSMSGLKNDEGKLKYHLVPYEVAEIPDLIVDSLDRLETSTRMDLDESTWSNMMAFLAGEDFYSGGKEDALRTLGRCLVNYVCLVDEDLELFTAIELDTILQFSEAMAEVFTLGAETYGERNWEGGFRYSRLFDAWHRHFVNRKRHNIYTDEDSGLPVELHEAANVLMLYAHVARGIGIDDRKIVDKEEASCIGLLNGIKDYA